MAIARDLKTGEFLNIPDGDAKKYVVAPDKVRETLASAGMTEGGPGDPGAPPPMMMGQGMPMPQSIVLNLNLAELMGRAGMPMPGRPMPMPMPAGAPAGSPQVSAQWWQWHPNHPYYGYHPHYWGGGGPGVWVHI
ncbi:MAG: hypothetical protein AMXMBFR33_06340 [Candidatus Xenobia bacterium]